MSVNVFKWTLLLLFLPSKSPTTQLQHVRPLVTPLLLLLLPICVSLFESSAVGATPGAPKGYVTLARSPAPWPLWLPPSSRNSSARSPLPRPCQAPTGDEHPSNFCRAWAWSEPWQQTYLSQTTNHTQVPHWLLPGYPSSLIFRTPLWQATNLIALGGHAMVGQ